MSDEIKDTELEQEVEAEAEVEAEQVDEAQTKIDAALAKADEYLLAAQRIQADFENYKRRNKNAIAEATEDGINEAVKMFLPVIDNVDRAVEAAEKFGDEAFNKGIELLKRQVTDMLEKLDVFEIDTNCPFDPNFHNAVMQAEKEEGMEDNQITDVFQKGYIRKGKVLRFSMVKVAK
jgi:molecular chaperone GrpE